MVVSRPVVISVVLLLTAAAMAGCLGGGGSDEPGDPGPGTGGSVGGGAGGSGGGGGQSQEGFGDVVGLVLDDGFMPLNGASVRLTKDGNTVAHTSTGANGLYEFLEVEAGTYRLAASHGCCQDHVESVTVRADQSLTRDLHLERRTGDDRQRPFWTVDEQSGFISCGFSILNELQETPCTLDPEHNTQFRWNVTQGLRTLIVYAQWEEQLTGPELSAQVSAQGQFTYKVENSTSVLELRIDNDQIEEPAFKWENIEGQLELFLDLLPGGDVGVVWQQEFRVFILEFHWRQAPPEFEFELPE